MVEKRRQKTKKIDLNVEKRFKTIRILAVKIQNPKTRSLKEIRFLAENIEILADTKLLKQLNKALVNVDKGKFTTIEKIQAKVKKR